MGGAGGAGSNFYLLLGVLGVTAAFAVGAFALAAFIYWLLALEGGKSGQLLIAAPVLGALASGPVWRAFLRYYRYDTALRPIADKDKPE